MSLYTMEVSEIKYNLTKLGLEIKMTKACPFKYPEIKMQGKNYWINRAEIPRQHDEI